MREGRFADAWAVSDGVLRAARPQDPVCPRHLQRVWTGGPLAGQRVLVRCYHGLGDTIQFVRFARPLRDIAASVSVWVQPSLLSLIAGVDGVDAVEPLTDGVPVTRFDVDIEVMELAHALRITPYDLGATRPYIRPLTSCPADLAGMIHSGDTVLRVGIAWRGGEWDRRRDISAKLIASLNIPGVRLFSFQQDGSAEAHSMGAADFGHLSVVEIASAVPELDLVITADTMLAHLAGAMGRPVWTLLPTPCDWRWMDAAPDTPWYPAMRLFRQETPGAWADVIGSVRAALRAEVRSSPPFAKLRGVPPGGEFVVAEDGPAMRVLDVHMPDVLLPA